MTKYDVLGECYVMENPQNNSLKFELFNYLS